MPFTLGGDPTLIDSIEIVPSSATISVDESVKFTALLHYTDTGGPFPSGETLDLTLNNVAWWFSTDDELAIINNGIVSGGTVHGHRPGSCSIGVWYAPLTGFPPSSPPPSPGDPPYPPPEGADATSVWVELTVTPAPEPPPDPEGRFLLAFDDPLSAPYPAWTRLDSEPNLVSSYTIDRGRAFELDRTDTGRAVVTITDTDGLLDPTNSSGPYYGKIQPLTQAAIGRYDPVAEEWKLRYRGFVEDLDYQTDPSQKLNRLVVSLVDQFEILNGAELTPGQFGAVPPADSEGQVYFPEERVEDRIARILSNFGLPGPFRVLLPGNVDVQRTVYSPGETALSAIQEAADAEFPAVANVYCDRRGRLAFHGREAKFDPVGVSSAFGPGTWPYQAWEAGDGAAVAASPTDTAQVRVFAFNRGLSRIINSATAAPAGSVDESAGQLVANAASIGRYGTRSWSAGTLLTAANHVDGSTAITEARRFSGYYVANYKQPQNRVQDVTFRSLEPADARAGANWALLNGVDIADSVMLTVALPGGGGFSSAAYFVEGVHEDCRPLAGGYDDVTLRLDLSPRLYFSYDPWSAGAAPPSDFEAEQELSYQSVGRMTSSRRRPALHRREHEHGGADPMRIHYEKVGGAGAGAVAGVIPYSVSGALTVADGGLRWYALADGTISLIYVSVGTAPTGSGLTVRVNKNGTSLGTVTIAAGSHTNSFTPASPAYSTGDFFTVDLTAIGSSTAGSDLVVELQVGSP